MDISAEKLAGAVRVAGLVHVLAAFALGFSLIGLPLLLPFVGMVTGESSVGLYGITAIVFVALYLFLMVSTPPAERKTHAKLIGWFFAAQALFIFESLIALALISARG